MLLLLLSIGGNEYLFAMAPVLQKVTLLTGNKLFKSVSGELAVPVNTACLRLFLLPGFTNQIHLLLSHITISAACIISPQ